LVQVDSTNNVGVAQIRQQTGKNTVTIPGTETQIVLEIDTTKIHEFSVVGYSAGAIDWTIYASCERNSTYTLPHVAGINRDWVSVRTGSSSAGTTFNTNVPGAFAKYVLIVTNDSSQNNEVSAWYCGNSF